MGSCAAAAQGGSEAARVLPAGRAGSAALGEGSEGRAGEAARGVGRRPPAGTGTTISELSVQHQQVARKMALES